MIKIQSVRELTFDPVTRVTGIIEVEIINYTRNVVQGTYNLTLQDSVLIPTTMMEPFHIPAKYNEDGSIKEPERWEEREVTYMERESRIRNRVYKDAELNQLIAGLQVEEPITIENIDDVFRDGLLYITQMECDQNKGIYFSKSEDWEPYSI